MFYSLVIKYVFCKNKNTFYPQWKSEMTWKCSSTRFRVIVIDNNNSLNLINFLHYGTITVQFITFLNADSLKSNFEYRTRRILAPTKWPMENAKLLSRLVSMLSVNRTVTEWVKNAWFSFAYFQHKAKIVSKHVCLSQAFNIHNGPAIVSRLLKRHVFGAILKGTCLYASIFYRALNYDRVVVFRVRIVTMTGLLRLVFCLTQRKLWMFSALKLVVCGY